MKVGDYVRTRNGLIFKIVNGNEDNYDIDIPFKTIELSEGFGENLLAYNDNGWYFNNEKNIAKSSPNIIDLIEVGDYVNGSKVYHKARIDTDDYGNDFKEVGIESDTYLYHWVEEKDIKSIVTKEQFSFMEYKVN